MVGAGVRWIQIRAKSAFDDELVAGLEACCRALEGSEAEIWVNDRPDLARLFPVAGVHLGQDDLEPEAARRVVGPRKMIGRSTHNEGQLREADADSAVDVIAIGPVYPTASKENPEEIVGLEGLRRARLLTRKPLVAIGGIDEHNLSDVLEAGADSVAMVGAVCHGDIEANCRRLGVLAEAGA
jgi:thiamine-phosphate pyrophosphorylase